jgi:hypothetical protein
MNKFDVDALAAKYGIVIERTMRMNEPDSHRFLRNNNVIGGGVFTDEQAYAWITDHVAATNLQPTKEKEVSE